MVTAVPTSAAPTPAAAAPRRDGTPRTAIVAGGGIAGIAAAIRLVDAGVSVTLIETRKKLGGRATSFTDVRTGHVIDNCQHVALRCCTNYLDFLARLGVADRIVWHREQFWVEAGGRTTVLSRLPLPAPLQFGLSFLRAKFLSLGEAAAIGRACAAILRTDRTRHADRTFGDYLRSLGQSNRVIARFWSPVIVSACNLDVDRVAASSAIHVFQEGFLAHPAAADIGVPSVPLVELYDRAEAVITGSGGGRLLLGESVARITRTSVETADGATHTADAVVCALPVERVNKAVGPALREADPRFAPLDRFEHSPILGVHLEFDRPVLPHPHAVLVERPTQWLFRKDAEGRRIHAVISAADDWVALDEAAITQRVLADIHACFPASQAAALVSSRPVKEKRATFAPTPGLDALRPGPAGPSGIVLAGDYTDTGWPATMEGAARSGYAAAAAVLGTSPAAAILPSLPVGTIPRLLAPRAPRQP